MDYRERAQMADCLALAHYYDLNHGIAPKLA
jgi:hypothetical protein